jgi:hypothetical protein
MIKQEDKETNASPNWKYWTAIVFAAWNAGFISFARASSAIVDNNVSLDARASAIAGPSLAVSLVVWTICYFLVIGGSPTTTKWLALLAIVGAAILGALLGHEF